MNNEKKIQCLRGWQVSDLMSLDEWLGKKECCGKKKMKMMTRRRGPKERNLQLPSFQSVVCWTLCVISISSSDLSKVCVSRCLHPAPADQRDLDGQIPSSGGFLTSQPFHQTHPKLPSATHAGRNLFPLVNSGKHSCSSPTMNTRWLLKCHVAVFLRLPHRNLLQLLLKASPHWIKQLFLWGVRVTNLEIF